MTPLPPTHSLLITSALDRLRLLSPITWYGLMQVSSRSPFTAFQLEKLRDATLGVILPLITFFLCMQLIETKRQANISWHRMLALSPWVWHCSRQLLVQLSFFFQTVMNYFRNRNHALPSAIEGIRMRIASNRAYRTRRYDVYLPPSSLTMRNNAQSKTQKAIVMLPGALVPHPSYSELAGRLSDTGLLVVVTSLEPCLLADPNLGADIGSIRRIMSQIQKQLRIDNMEWILMGHSMGAFGAMRLYDQFHKQQSDKKIRDLVLLGVAPFINECTDLSHYNNFTETRILLIQASDDVLVELLEDRQKELYTNFPVDTTARRDILGATHHGFASYDDDDGQITRHEQQQQVCDLVQDFLNEDEE
jgi:hypothetical protein